ncbi:MAG: glycosyltransferase family 2 protein [Bacteroidales bacterium]
MKIALVFPVFNGLHYTQKCLDAVFSQLSSINSSTAIFEVVVVDDGSTDGSNDWIRMNFPQVHLLEGNGNLWWSGGINKAVEYGLYTLNTDYFLWWNNDIIPEKNYFFNLASLLKHHEPDTIIGSKILLAHQPDTIWSMGGLFDARTGFKNMIGAHQKDNDSFNKIVSCDWLTGMGTVTHSSVYRKIGFIDNKRFPQYHGDSDFTFRAKKAGYSIIVDPSLVIYNDTRNSGLRHDERFSRLFKSLFSIRSNYNLKKDFLFYRKHAVSPRAFLIPLTKYIKYIGGFFKWKFLGLFGVKKV